jgi:polyisoprenoid-binding protein YceI
MKRLLWDICSRAVIETGTYRFGPGSATLSVRTRRGGAAAKAGHDLEIHVTVWQGTLEVADDATSAELTADATSLRVHKGTGGIQALGDDDKANIEQTIEDEVLERQDIAFRSTRVEPGTGGRLSMEGELTLAGTTKPIAFDLELAGDGALRAAVTVTQSRWGMKPYSALFGTLKVLDDVEVVLEGHPQDQSR